MRMIFVVLAVLTALWASPVLAAPQAKPVEWKIGKQVFSGYLVYDDANAIKRPGLVMVPDWLGVTPAAVDKARKIAGDDYVVLVVDMYGKGIRPKDPAEALAQIEITPSGFGLHWPLLDADLSVTGLLAGVFGNALWMREIASRGGKATSPAKAVAYMPLATLKGWARSASGAVLD